MQNNQILKTKARREENLSLKTPSKIFAKFQDYYLTDISFQYNFEHLSFVDTAENQEKQEEQLLTKNKQPKTQCIANLQSSDFITEFSYAQDDYGIYMFTLKIRQIHGQLQTYNYPDEGSLKDFERKGEKRELITYQQKDSIISDFEIFKESNLITKISVSFGKPPEITQDLVQNQINFLGSKTVAILESFASIKLLEQNIPTKAKNEKLQKHFKELDELIDIILENKDDISDQLYEITAVIKSILNEYEEIMQKMVQNSDKNGNLKRFSKEDYENEANSLNQIQTEVDKCISTLQKLLNNLKDAKRKSRAIKYIKQELINQEKIDELKKLKWDEENQDLSGRQLQGKYETENRKCQEECENLDFEIERLVEQFISLELEIKSVNENLESLQNQQKILNNNAIDVNGGTTFQLEDQLKVHNKIKELNNRTQQKIQTRSNQSESQQKILEDRIQALQELGKGQYELKKKYHIISALDESGSMDGSWKLVQQSCKQFISTFDDGGKGHLATLILFDDSARLINLKIPPKNVIIPEMRSGGTNFLPALDQIDSAIQATPKDFKSIVVFMTDGEPWEGQQSILNKLKDIKNKNTSKSIEFFFIGFGDSYNRTLLQAMSQEINNSLVFQMRGKETEYVLNAKDEYALDQTYKILSDYIQDDYIQQQIIKLCKEKQQINEQLQIDTKFIEQQSIIEFEIIKKQEEQFQQILKESVENQAEKVKIILAEQIKACEDKKELLNQKFNLVSQQKNEKEIAQKIAQKHLKESEVKLQHLDSELKQQLAQQKEKAKKVEEEINKTLEESGFHSNGKMLNFYQNIEQPATSIKHLKATLLLLQTFLRETKVRIKRLVQILSQTKQISIGEEKIIKKMQKQYENDIPDIMKKQANLKEAIKLVLKEQIPDEYDDLVIFFDRLYEEINLQEISKLRGQRDKIYDYVEYLIEEIYPSGGKPQQTLSQKTNQVTMEYFDSSDGSDSDVKQPQGKTKKPKITEQPANLNQTNINTYQSGKKIQFTKVKIEETIQVAEVKQHKLFDKVTKIKDKYKEFKKNLMEMKKNKDDQYNVELQKKKAKKSKKKDKLKKNTQELIDVQNEITFHKFLLNKDIMTKQVKRLIDILIKYTSRAVKECINEACKDELQSQFSLTNRQILQPAKNLEIVTYIFQAQSIQDMKQLKKEWIISQSITEEEKSQNALM